MASPVACVLEVNECRINATGSGAEWWAAFRQRMEPVDRITIITPSLGGDLVLVACTDRAHAEWLRDHMASEGVPLSATRIKRLPKVAVTDG